MKTPIILLLTLLCSCGVPVTKCAKDILHQEAHTIRTVTKNNFKKTTSIKLMGIKISKVFISENLKSARQELAFEVRQVIKGRTFENLIGCFINFEKNSTWEIVDLFCKVLKIKYIGLEANASSD